MEIDQEMRQILSSVAFIHSPRARLLLQYIVDLYHQGLSRELNEYTIGLEVFRRDAATYSTVDDPIVRVQMGRLRKKLNQYYATDGQCNSIRILVPLRSFRPSIVKQGVEPTVLHMVFIPLQYLGNEPLVNFFNQGLNEEISYRIGQMYGVKFLVNRGAPLLDRSLRLEAGLELEGTLRADCTILRVSLRLISLKSQCCVWRTQVDAPRMLSIAQQAKLAEDCCQAFKNYLMQSEITIQTRAFQS